ncbi:MAG: hypothetical protein KGI54_08355 [Pseudomonadota bacterium]|nr:hypothetical protein [Pseudomonadota bacterium]
MKQFLRGWLTQKSTCMGIFWLLSAFGIYQFTPDQANAIAYMAQTLSVAGVSGAVIPDSVFSKIFKKPAPSVTSK